MKNKYLVIFWVLILVLAACSSNDQTASAPAQKQNDITVIPTVIQTFAPVQSDTPLPTTIMTATMFTTPISTATRENSVLAESGYDFANVLITYPNKDQVYIDLQYQIARYDGFNSHAIALILPSSCKNARNLNDPARYGDGLFYTFKDSSAGQVRLSYTQTSEGECDVPYFYLALYSPYDNWAAIDENIVYQERIDQSFKVVRDSPAINSKTLTVKNFSFQTTGPWSGGLTFEYAFSPEIPIPGEQYSFSVSGFGGNLPGCWLFANGPFISKSEGVYTINIYSSSVKDSKCFSERNSISYNKVEIALEKIHSVSHIYHHVIDGLTITLERSP